MKQTTVSLVLALVASLAISQVLTAPSPQAENEIPSASGDAAAAITQESNSSSQTTSTTTSSTLGTTETPKDTTSGTTPGEDDSSNFEFTSNQNTSTFTCEGKVTGYYADVKLKCRVYHFCTQMDSLEGPAYQRMSYLCLEGSFFDQKDLNCVKEADMKVPCNKAEAEFEKSNKQFDAKEDAPPSMSDSIAANIMMNPITRFIAGR